LFLTTPTPKQHAGVAQAFRNQLPNYFSMIRAGDLVSIVVIPHKPKMGIVVRTRNVQNSEERSYALVHTFDTDEPRYVTLDCLKLISRANL
jgi:hypothetical protein